MDKYPHSVAGAGSRTLNLKHRKRGPKLSEKAIEAISRLEAAVNKGPALLARLSENDLSEKELAKICGCDPEKERHYIRTARAHVLSEHATK